MNARSILSETTNMPPHRMRVGGVAGHDRSVHDMADTSARQDDDPRIPDSPEQQAERRERARERLKQAAEMAAMARREKKLT